MNPSQRAPCRLSHALSLGVRPLNWAGSRPDPHMSPKPDHDAGAAETGSRLRGSCQESRWSSGTSRFCIQCGHDEQGSKSAGDLIKIIFADFMPALLQVSISVALAATVEPLVGAIMLASGLTNLLVTRTQLRSQDGVRVGIARKKSHLDGSMTELLRGKPIVCTLNAVELEASRVRREATDLSKIERRHHRTMGLLMPER